MTLTLSYVLAQQDNGGNLHSNDRGEHSLPQTIVQGVLCRIIGRQLRAWPLRRQAHLHPQRRRDNAQGRRKDTEQL